MVIRVLQYFYGFTSSPSIGKTRCHWRWVYMSVQSCCCIRITEHVLFIQESRADLHWGENTVTSNGRAEVRDVPIDNPYVFTLHWNHNTVSKCFGLSKYKREEFLKWCAESCKCAKAIFWLKTFEEARKLNWMRVAYSFTYCSQVIFFLEYVKICQYWIFYC